MITINFAISFYFFNVVTGELKISYVVCIIFLVDGARLVKEGLCDTSK